MAASLSNLQNRHRIIEVYFRECLLLKYCFVLLGKHCYCAKVHEKQFAVNRLISVITGQVERFRKACGVLYQILCA